MGKCNLKKVSYIDVRNTLTYAGISSGDFSEKLKSPATRRSIPIPKILAEALREEKLKTPKKFVVPTTKSDNGLPNASYKRYWKTLLGNLSFYVHPHLLWHTYITELCASGLDIKKV